MRVGILTMSDSGTRGEREDLSGPLIAELLGTLSSEIVQQAMIPDDAGRIAETLTAWSGELDLIVTTGGTGLGPRDVTPQATLSVIDYEVPGMAEAMRAVGRAKTPMAMLSRGVVGVRGATLIINLPGSPKGVRENLETLLPVLPHAVNVLRGHTIHG